MKAEGFDIPALTLAGGKLGQYKHYSDALEYRIWIHPLGGSDFYYSFNTLKDARKRRGELMEEFKKGRSEFARVEPVIAVVWDRKYHNFREVRI